MYLSSWGPGRLRESRALNPLNSLNSRPFPAFCLLPTNFIAYQCPWHASSSQNFDCSSLRSYRPIQSTFTASEGPLEKQSVCVFLSRNTITKPLSRRLLVWLCDFSLDLHVGKNDDCCRAITFLPHSQPYLSSTLPSFPTQPVLVAHSAEIAHTSQKPSDSTLPPPLSNSPSPSP